MRCPTDIVDAFAWWRDALAGLKPAITTSPQCGFFQRRFARGGVMVPVAIWIEQNINPETGELSDDEKMVCLVNGEPASPDDTWTYCAGNPITESEYRYLESRHRWARAHAPNDPFASPSKKIDFNSLSPDF